MDRNERNQWVIDNMAFIHTVIRRFKNMSNYEDIAQTACYAAIEALDRCEPNCDEKRLRQYVSKYINGYVIKYCINNNCIVYIPHHERTKVKLLVDSINYEYYDGERPKTFEELYLGYDEPGFEEAETKVDYERFLGKLKESKRKVVMLMAENGSRKKTAKIMGFSRDERVRQIVNEVKPKFCGAGR